MTSDIRVPAPEAPAESSLENIDLIIFDCDGVLIDSEPIASRTLAEALQRAGIEITAAEAHEKFTGNSVTIIAQMIARDHGLADLDGLFAGWHTALFAEFASSLTPMAGMTGLVRSISRPKCVASNSTMQRLKGSLGHLELWELFFPRIYSADAVARPKPAPDLMLHCAEQFEVAPGRCVMIDDSPHGIEAANAAGMLAIGFADPADPRPGRTEILRRAGARFVATGVAELRVGLAEANAVLGDRPRPL
ncbi:HAD family hydrolase [Devosia nitrariae]|uniref:HAD family hydrolase n=1 Tax=Devosia nitrariae TaxID=2071872 RepID=UPI0024E06769|nr:HAD family hydrolase [Devosia nitrariae]